MCRQPGSPPLIALEGPIRACAVKMPRVRAVPGAEEQLGIPGH